MLYRKKEATIVQLDPTTTIVTTYKKAVEEFPKNAPVLAEQARLFEKVRKTYEQATDTHTDLCQSLDTGDQSLCLVMGDFERAFGCHAAQSISRDRGPKQRQVEVTNSDTRGGIAANE